MTVWEWIKGRLGASERRQRLRWRDKVGGKRKQEAAWRSGSPLPAHPGCLSSHPVSPFSPKAAKSSQCISQPHIHFISSSLSLPLSSFCYFSPHFSVAVVAQNSFLWFFQLFRLCIFYQNIIHKADTAWEITSGEKPLKENEISPSTLTFYNCQIYSYCCLLLVTIQYLKIRFSIFCQK